MKVGIGVEEPPEFGRVVRHDSRDAAPERLLVLGLRVEHPHVDPDAPGSQVMEEPGERGLLFLRCYSYLGFLMFCQQAEEFRQQ